MIVMTFGSEFPFSAFPPSRLLLMIMLLSVEMSLSIYLTFYQCAVRLLFILKTINALNLIW